MVKNLLVILAILFVFAPSIVSAQTNTSTDSAATKLRQQLQEIQAQKKAAVSEIKEEAKETRMDLRKQITETVKARKEAVKEAVATRKEEFKTKLQALKDEKKKVLVDRIDTKLTNVNTKHTDRFTEVLGNLQTLLDKISEDVDKTTAQAAIDAAQTAVVAQAAKTYTITISTETALKSDVGVVTSQLRQDLVTAHKLVTEAKQAVQALRENTIK